MERILGRGRGGGGRYGCGTSGEEEGGVFEPGLGGGEVGHRFFGRGGGVISYVLFKFGRKMIKNKLGDWIQILEVMERLMWC